MNRRSDSVHGHVNFPVNDSRYKNSGEGGMFVKLVAEADDNAVCCGAHVADVLSECLIGDKLKEHYPRADEPTEKYSTLAKYVSVPYEFSILLGSTGWSGWDGDKYWTCTFEDLTDSGKELYCMMEKMYPDCKLELLTFLDT